MPQDLQLYLYTHPGRENWPGGAAHRMRLADQEGKYSHISAFSIGRMVNRETLMRFGDVFYNNFEYTETKQNSSTIASVGSGIRFQTQGTPTDGDKVEIISNRTFTPISGTLPPGDKPSFYIAFARAQVSSAANMGLSFGFVTSGSTGVIAANPADGVFVVKAKNAAGLTARTIQGGGSAHDVTTFNLDNSSSPATGTVSMVDATFMELGIKFFIGPTAAQSWGEWWINGFRTPMSTAQVADIFAMVAGAPTLAAQLGFAVNGTTQRNAIVDFALAEVDK